MSWLKLKTLQSDRLTAAELHNEEACVLQTSHLQQKGLHFSRLKACRHIGSQCYVTVGASDSRGMAGELSSSQSTAMGLHSG